jgi:hypothetical protein
LEFCKPKLQVITTVSPILALYNSVQLALSLLSLLCLHRLSPGNGPKRRRLFRFRVPRLWSSLAGCCLTLILHCPSSWALSAPTRTCLPLATTDWLTACLQTQSQSRLRIRVTLRLAIPANQLCFDPRYIYPLGGQHRKRNLKQFLNGCMFLLRQFTYSCVSLCCCGDMFTKTMFSNCRLDCCSLAINVYSCPAIPVFSRYVTILNY